MIYAIKHEKKHTRRGIDGIVNFHLPDDKMFTFFPGGRFYYTLLNDKFLIDKRSMPPWFDFGPLNFREVRKIIQKELGVK